MNRDLGRVGFVFGPGGHTGAYSVGFAKAAVSFGIKPVCVQGVSVGSIIAAKFVERDGDISFLEAGWTFIEEQGHRFIFPYRTPSLLKKSRSGCKYSLSNNGIKRLVRDIDMRKVVASEIGLQVLAFNESTRKQEIFLNHESDAQEDPQKLACGVVASTAMPSFFSPFIIARTVEGRSRKSVYSDGQLIDIQAVFDYGCDTVFVFINSPLPSLPHSVENCPKSLRKRFVSNRDNTVTVHIDQERKRWKRQGSRVIFFQMMGGVETLSTVYFKKGDIIRAIDLAYARGVEILEDL